MGENGYNEDSERKWLIERSHNAYLRWLAVWLASMFGILNILCSILSKQGISGLPTYHMWLVEFMYWGLVSGMMFSVYRLVNCVSELVNWAIGIRRCIFLKEVTLNNRGFLSRFFVDQTGRILELDCLLVYAVHVIIAGFFLALDLSAKSVVDWNSMLFLVIIPAVLVFLAFVLIDLRTRSRRAVVFI